MGKWEKVVALGDYMGMEELAGREVLECMYM